MSRRQQLGLDNLLATALLAVLSVATALGLSRVFSEWEYLQPVVTVALVMHLVCLLLRRLPLPAVVALLIALVVLAEITVAVYYRDTMRFGFPTDVTWQYFRADLRLVWAQFPTAVAPVPSGSAFGVVAGLSLGAAAILADAFAFRALGRTEALVPTAVVFVFTAALGVDRHRIALTAIWLAAALAVVAVLRAMHGASSDGWIGRRATSPSALPAAAACAAFCALGAALVGPLLPGAGKTAIIETRQTATDDGAVLSPLVDIRARLVNRSNVEMFTVSSAAGRYWRISGLDDFDGTTWTLTSTDLEAANGVFDPPSSEARIMVQSITIGRLGGRLVPSAYRPVEVSQPGLGWQRATNSLFRLDAPLAPGQTYNIAADIAVPSPAVLAAATVTSPPDPNLFRLPEGFPGEVVDLAQEVVKGATTPYAKALALQGFFRDNFVYDIDVQRGHSDDALVSFLRERRGYCEQFSASFAAMGRAVGLPTRVAVGFTQGELRSDGIFHVLGRHAHAWPEVWFDGVGWVLFEPTPGRGAPGSEDVTGVAAVQDTGTAADDDQPTTATTVAPSTTRPTATTEPNRPTPTTTVPTLPPPSSGESGSRPGPLGIAMLALAGLVLWALAMPTLVRRFVHVGTTPAAQVISAWHGAVAAAEWAGASPPRGATPIEYAHRVEHELGIDGRPMFELARFVTRAVYAPSGVGEPAALRAAVLRTQVIEASNEVMPRWRRWQCRLDPRAVRERLVGRRRISAATRSPGAGDAAQTPA